ncbi:hypothetical protein BH09ACT8_BH09ACT8_21540 [soil metagenome]
MQLAVRSYVTAGVALVGAGAIAVSPISLAPPEVHVPSIHAAAMTVDLAAAIDPITEWVQVLTTTFNNVAALGSQVQSDPSPILQQFITNQLAYAAIVAPALEQAAGSVVAGMSSIPQTLLTAATQLAAGNFNDAVQTVFQAGLGLVLAPAISLLTIPDIFTQATQHFANVVAAIPNVLLPIGLSALQPLAGAAYVFGDTGQQVIDGVNNADLGAAISAIVNAPAAFTDAILNGVAAQGTVGLLSPYTGQFSSGLFAALLNARDTFAQALGAPAPPSAQAVTNAVAELPTEAKTVTLSTAVPGIRTPHTSAAAVTPEKTTEATASVESSTAAKPAAAQGSAGTSSADSSSDSTTPGLARHRAQSSNAGDSSSSTSRDSVKKPARSGKHAAGASSGR